MDSQSRELWLERMIREAEEAGEFDGLEGAGKPIDDLDRVYESAWWARRFLERQRLDDAAVDLATRVREELPRLLAGKDQRRARAGLEALNDEIIAWNAQAPGAERLPSLDVERLLAERARRHS